MATPHQPLAFAHDASQAAIERASSRTPTVVDKDVLYPEETQDDVNIQFEHEAYGPAEGEKALDSFEVIMRPDDPDNPKTWSRPYRWYITMLSAVLVLNAYVFDLYPFNVPFSCASEHLLLPRHPESSRSSWRSSLLERRLQRSPLPSSLPDTALGLSYGGLYQSNMAANPSSSSASRPTPVFKLDARCRKIQHPS